jgi:5'-phosphate synthase pdxT subunit
MGVRHARDRGLFVDEGLGMSVKKIGVLALQGDFEAHERMLAKIGAEHSQIRKREDLEKISGLIIPGGESTAMIKLMKSFDLIEPIKTFYKQGKAIFGTCAGSILLAKEIANSDQFRFGFIDMCIERNGYGRQVQSFEKDISVKELGAEPFHAVFIRAPKILRCADHVKILAELDGSVVAALENNILVSTFHPEVTEDARLHKYFVNHMVL